MKKFLLVIATVLSLSFQDSTSTKKLVHQLTLNAYLTTLIAIDWAIIGGESGNDSGKYRYRPCEVKWMEEIAQAIQGVGNAVFVKQMGTYLAKQFGMNDRHGRDINEFPASLRIREFPKL